MKRAMATKAAETCRYTTYTDCEQSTYGSLEISRRRLSTMDEFYECMKNYNEHTRILAHTTF